MQKLMKSPLTFAVAMSIAATAQMPVAWSQDDDMALEEVNATRAELGALTNRLESTVNNLSQTKNNIADAESRIMDADFAAETAQLSKSQIIQQASVSVLAQANAAPQVALSLI